MTRDQLYVNNVDCRMLYNDAEYVYFGNIKQIVNRLKYLKLISNRCGPLVAVDVINENNECVWVVKDYTTWPDDLVEEYINERASLTKVHQSHKIYEKCLKEYTTIKKLQDVTEEELQEILYKNEVFITNVIARIKNQEMINELTGM